MVKLLILNCRDSDHILSQPIFKSSVSSKIVEKAWLMRSENRLRYTGFLCLDLRCASAPRSAAIGGLSFSRCSCTLERYREKGRQPRAPVKGEYEER
jgi:hypothetical protein